MNTSSHIACIVCQSSDVRSFLKIEQVPIFCNVQWSSREEARNAPLGEIDLVHCSDCGHIFNTAFDPARIEYTQSYENSLHFSPHFHAHAEALASRLIDKYDLRNKTIVEIGCGKGEFISMLCEAGDNRGYGFDTSYDEHRESKVSSQSVTFINDFYGERYADLKADFLCCRHVLEHIQYPADFLPEIRKAISGDNATIVYFEVPNALYSINDMGIWDFIYEHCSYFCMQSLIRCFQGAGFHILDTYPDFGNQFLCIEVGPVACSNAAVSTGQGLSELSKTIRQFENLYRKKVTYWNQELTGAASASQRIALWGSGSKGVTFLNCIDKANAIGAIVDINPNKQGKFVAGTGHEIVAPESLTENVPDIVIVMNPLYQTEITSILEDLGIQARVVCA